MNKNTKIIAKIERACNDLRKNIPVIIDDTASIIAENTSYSSIKLLEEVSNGQMSLNITANRAKHLINNYNDNHNISIHINSKNILNINDLISSILVDKDIELAFKKTTSLEDTSIELSKISELMPATITAKLDKNIDISDYSFVTSKEIELYNQIVTLELKEQTRTSIKLTNAENSQIIAFRPNIGGKEHYAIVIGKISDEPLVRVHSSCYTGDLLASLECDCRDQLHAAIEIMGKNEGGIILYMLQEGRGIGLINKLRAYVLKKQGFDTVDANEILGFDDDARLFEPAAQILKQLNISKIQLLSNNPKKSKGLENLGIKVTKCVPHIVHTHEHNKEYLKTKVDRMGHKIDKKKD